MSNGNGRLLTYDDAARIAHTIGQRGPLPAAEREQQRVAYIAAVDGMATVLRETVAAVAELQRALSYELKEAKRREDALWVSLCQVERNLNAHRNMSFAARLRWLVTGQ